MTHYMFMSNWHQSISCIMEKEPEPMLLVLVNGRPRRNEAKEPGLAMGFGHAH